MKELLSFSRASLGAKQVEGRVVEVRPLLEQAKQREAGGMPVNLKYAAELFVRADRELLRRAVSNLVRNAVTDRGPAIPAEALPHLFDPFYRLDPCRARAQPAA